MRRCITLLIIMHASLLVCSVVFVLKDGSDSVDSAAEGASSGQLLWAGLLVLSTVPDCFSRFRPTYIIPLRINRECH